ncbi:permease [Diaporthe amygdali]|uniref:permease n=1 Tax=Phomopsis amygdali TaxID=1214568 RepID=UPI0022FDFE72|nr:permease [Diaporthe amygdali]KAJ0117389.1 permease [Diaporthe amygdali]
MEEQPEKVQIAAGPTDIALVHVPSQHMESVPEKSTATAFSSTLTSTIKSLNERLEALSAFEARGIARVPPEERQLPSTSSDVQIALLWFSANISCNNLIVGLYGPMLFQLGFLDSAIQFLDPVVVLRYFFGWWPAKLPTVLNIILMIGYCCIDGILGGQILSAVSDGTVSIAVGIVIVNLVCWVIVLFGMRPFQQYERFAWIPQLLVLFVLIGCAGPAFDVSSASVGDAATVAANRLSFLSMCLYVPNSWSAAASDFFVYYPETTAPLKVASLTIIGLWLAFGLVYMIGIGLGSGIMMNTSWATAFDTSTGALVEVAFRPLHGFGKFCAVILALGLISNSVPGTYSATMCAQVLGRAFQATPRWIWSSFLLGWLGAVLGMYQTWYIGPLAKLANLSDVGVWIGMAFTLVSFPVLRYWELSKFGR